MARIEESVDIKRPVDKAFLKHKPRMFYTSTVIHTEESC